MIGVLWPIPEFLLITHVDVSMIYIFNGNFSAEYVIRLQSEKFVVIPSNANVSAIVFPNRMVVKISFARFNTTF